MNLRRFGISCDKKVESAGSFFASNIEENILELIIIGIKSARNFIKFESSKLSNSEILLEKIKKTKYARIDTGIAIFMAELIMRFDFSFSEL